MKILLSLLAVLVGAAAWSDQPIVLIVQFKVDVTSRDDPNYAMGNVIAEQLDIEGRVKPIVWSLADPEFRAAIDSGKLGEFNPQPTPEEMNEASKKLHAEYLFVLSAKMVGGSLDSAAQLYHGSFGKAIWTEKKVLGVSGSGGTDWDNTARSIANTWAVHLSEGPFKKLRAQPRLSTPPPEKGQGGNTGDPIAPPIVSDPIKVAQDLMLKGQDAEAITMLRASVDDKPFDTSRREALIRALLGRNLYQEAASEARRAILIAPGDPTLRLLSARAWLRIGKVEEAQKDLNEALARDVQDPIVQLLLGELALEKGEPEKAIEPYQTAMGKEDTFEARLGLGICFGLTGNARGAADAFNNLPHASDDEVFDGYERAIRLLDVETDKLAADLRDAMQKLHLKPNDAGTIEKLDSKLKLAQSLSALISALPCPKMHAASQQRRDLAHKLLVQSTEQILEFAKSGDEDAGAEALLSLGEAMKQIGTIRKQFGYEKVSGSAASGS